MEFIRKCYGRAILLARWLFLAGIAGVIHYQFATVLNPDKTAYAFWSVEGLLYAAAAFVAMSVITGALIYIIECVKPLRFLLFGKSEKRSGMENRST